jgi:hypothetical protein
LLDLGAAQAFSVPKSVAHRFEANNQFLSEHSTLITELPSSGPYRDQ